MKYVIEDGFSKIKKTGIGQYTLMIEELLKELQCDIIKIEKPFLSKIKNRFLRRILYNLWFNSIFLFKLLFISDAVTVICTNYAIPIFKLHKVRFISVIHDLSAFKYPECSSKLINLYEKSNIKNALNSYKIITVSNTIKNEIITAFNIDKEKIFVVNSSLTTGLKESKEIDFNVLKEKYQIEPQKYILCVATNNKRKNISILVEVFDKISQNNCNIKLVLVGSNYKEQENSNIIITGYISDGELKSLYKNALTYVFPSIYEGFGTPIIDAQSFGVPVLCSDIPIFREVAGESAEFFELEKSKLQIKIENLIQDKNRCDFLKQKGFENIKHYTYSNISNQLKEVLND